MAFEEKEFKWALKTSGDFRILRDMLKRSPIFSFFRITDKFILIKDIYFDAKDSSLSRAKTALRLRRAEGKYEITLKSAGVVKDGLYTREEHTKKLRIASKKHAMASLQKFVAEVCQNPAAPALKEIFIIKTRRQQFNLTNEKLTAQLCLDSSFIKAGGKSLRLYEMEFEYKKGSFALFSETAEMISKITGIAGSKKSKVASAVGLLKNN